MDTRKIPVLCYWNGFIRDGHDGPFYEGSVPRVIRVESNIDFPKLLDQHRVTGFEKGKFQIELICRYPSIVQQSMVKFVRMPIVDDCSLETMLEVPSYHPSISNVELYLEAKPVLDEGISAIASSLANQATRKRSRLEDGNIDTDVNVSVKYNTLRTPREDNSYMWVEEEEGTDCGKCNCGNGGNSVTTQKDSTTESPGLTKSLVDNVPEQMIFSSSWLDERELHLGMVFRDKNELEKAVKLYSNRRQRIYTKYESGFSGIYDYKCMNTCVWILKAARTNNNSFKITEYIGPHNCKPANVCSDFLAGELKGLIMAQPSISVAELNLWVKEEFGYTVSCTNMWDAKKKGITAILGDSDKSFNVLPKLMAALSSSNKMVLEWQYDIFFNPKDAFFRSVFWAFQQSIEGFAHLRPLIIVDTIDLNGKYPAKMLVAGGFDAENRLFPLAFAITTLKSLSADTWRWFFACIRNKVTQREGLCLITSLNPEIVAVVNEPVCRWAQHRFCLRHMCFKFYDVFHNNLMTELVYKAGSARDISSFDYYLKKIEKMDPDARKWLEKMPPHLWALAYDDGGVRYGIMTANTIFTTYGFINKAHDFPISTCILLIFDDLAELFKSRHEYKVASLTHDVLPLDQTGESFQVTEVMQVEKKGFVVHFINRVCTCGIWQLCKYPCSHVLAACRRMNSDHLQYVNDCYNTESSLRVYAADFIPLPGVSNWPEASEVPRLLPPGIRPPSVFWPVTTEPSRNDTATNNLVIGKKRSKGKKQACESD
ncbi:hypothetical protein CARUB_v10025926mg [Capsella rubella]|uniref:SWIM-type domain-containing protein n=1 Tax=Capsella rubella TaxID=81985 RepID=R0GJA1_9BRAS|nr:hypothetical protein CARUB_v10025926mg [Capsella rubella]